MPARRVVLATGNRGKLREISALLAPRWEVLAQTQFGVSSPPETGASFLENALIKARNAAAVSALPAIGDDSGIEVDALGGAPGLYSARYAGETASDAENVAKLLEAMAGVPAAARMARFRCVIVYVDSATDSEPLVAEGIWSGRLTQQPRGVGGFGYDPVFEDPELRLTAAELTPVIKNERSHRGKACWQLRRLLEQRFPEG